MKKKERVYKFPEKEKANFMNFWDQKEIFSNARRW